MDCLGCDSSWNWPIPFSAVRRGCEKNEGSMAFFVDCFFAWYDQNLLACRNKGRLCCHRSDRYGNACRGGCAIAAHLASRFRSRAPDLTGIDRVTNTRNDLEIRLAISRSNEAQNRHGGDGTPAHRAL